MSAFFPQLDCEIAEIHHSLTTSVSPNAPGPALGIVLNGSLCTATNSKSLCDPQSQNCPSQAFVFNMYTLNGILSNNDCRIPTDDAYIFFVIGDVRYQQNASSGSLPSQEVSVANITGLVCKPSYAISQAHLELNPPLSGTLAGASISKVDSSPNTTLSGFTNSNLTSVWYESLSAIGTLYSNEADVDETLFHFMADVNNHSSIEALLDPSAQTAAATTIFTAVMAQFASEYLLAPADTILEGQIAYNENRLRIRSLSVWFNVAGLVLLIFAAVVVLVYRPHDVLPRNLDSISAISTILASSKGTKSSLGNTGHLSDEALQQYLSTNSYQTASSPSRKSFMIERQEAANWPLPPSRLSKMLRTSVITTSQNTEHHRGEPSSIPLDGSEIRWWRPFTIGLPFVMITLALPLVTIVLLEIIQQYSNKHEGFVDLQDVLASADALSNYFPAAFMMLMSAMFNSFDFTIMIFAPYSALARGNSPARRSIMSNYLGNIPVLVFLKAIFAHHWAVCFSTAAAIVGSFLTIVVSGLYVSNPVQRSSDIFVPQVDQFNLSWTNSVNNDSNAGITFGLVERYNISYPRFTYNELALPKIRLPDKNEAAQDMLRILLPATRATLNCTVVPSQGITVSKSNWESGGQANVTVQAQLPSSCKLGGLGGNDSSVTFNNNFQTSLANTTLAEPYGGIVLDLHLAPPFENSLGFQSYGDGAGSNEADNPSGCPSLGFIFGNFPTDGDANIDVTALVCSQLAEEVQTETHFLLPGLDLDPNNPPIPNESTVNYVANETNALPYRIQAAFDSEVIAYNGTQVLYPRISAMLDPFFQVLLYGQDSVDPTSLTGPANADRLINATNHIYRRYMAQAFNSNMRHNLSSSDGTTLNASLISMNKPRLAQDEASKIALQVLLAIMFVCGVAAHLLADTKRVLPHSPTSIAGVASLLAGSALVEGDLVPKGSEWMSDKEFKSKGIFQGERFGLGWWEGAEEGKGGRRFGIGVGKADSRV